MTRISLSMQSAKTAINALSMRAADCRRHAEHCKTLAATCQERESKDSLFRTANLYDQWALEYQGAHDELSKEIADEEAEIDNAAVEIAGQIKGE